jgi:hypothetical protein
VTDAGAKVLAGSKDVGNLELLEISTNSLTKEGIDSLEKAGIAKVLAANQYAPNSGDDLEYLFYGDME